MLLGLLFRENLLVAKHMPIRLVGNVSHESIDSGHFWNKLMPFSQKYPKPGKSSTKKKISTYLTYFFFFFKKKEQV